MTVTKLRPKRVKLTRTISAQKEIVVEADTLHEAEDIADDLMAEESSNMDTVMVTGTDWEYI